MKLVSIIPITKGILKKELTYFSTKDVSPGNIVTILLRKKEVEGLVVGVKDLKEEKTSLRKGDFELKKIQSVKTGVSLSPEFVTAIQKTAKYHVVGAGALLYRLLGEQALTTKARPQTPVSTHTKEHSPETLALQTSLEERIGFYKTYIRECFAKKESLFICFPTHEDIVTMEEYIKKGVEDYICILSAEISKKQLTQNLNKQRESEHPLVVMGTASFLYTLGEETKTIIIEHESSPLYKTFIPPLFDIRTCIRFLAKETGRKLILADTILQTETIWELKESLIESIPLTNFRFPKKHERIIVDTKTEETGAWSPIKKETREHIKRHLSSGKNVFLFVLRKGLAPYTMCSDCKKILLCETCSTPLTLYKQKDKQTRIFMCNTCTQETTTHRVCPYCQSWNLTPLGIGTQHIEEYIQKEFKETPTFILDQVHAKTKPQAKKIISAFEQEKGAILIGTELALHQQLGEIPLVVVVSFDSLFAIPSFRIHERILHLLIHLEEVASSCLIVQTKNTTGGVLRAFETGTLLQYYNNEIQEREDFLYPPFSTLIKIIPDVRTSKEDIKQIAQELFSVYKPNLFITTYNKQKLPAILLKIPYKQWNTRAKEIDQSLFETLSSLPPTWVIHVDPEQT